MKGARGDPRPEAGAHEDGGAPETAAPSAVETAAAPRTPATTAGRRTRTSPLQAGRGVAGRAEGRVEGRAGVVDSFDFTDLTRDTQKVSYVGLSIFVLLRSQPTIDTAEGSCQTFGSPDICCASANTLRIAPCKSYIAPCKSFFLILF